jgi:hypothetical protein
LNDPISQALGYIRRQHRGNRSCAGAAVVAPSRHCASDTIADVRVRPFFRWLFVDPLMLWMSLGIPLMPLMFFVWLRPASELNVRLAGYGLTLAGIFIVVNSIRAKTRLFGRPSVHSRARSWLARFPTFFGRAKPQTVALQGHLGVSIGGSAELSFSRGPDASLEQRIFALEQNLDGLTVRVATGNQKMKEALQQVSETHAREISAVRSTANQFGSRFEELSVGSLDVELAAVVWVVFGNLYTTFPQEVANLLRHAF